VAGSSSSGVVFKTSEEDARKIPELVKILGKSYDIADFQNFLRKTYDHNYLKLIISKHKHK